MAMNAEERQQLRQRSMELCKEVEGTYDGKRSAAVALAMLAIAEALEESLPGKPLEKQEKPEHESHGAAHESHGAAHPAAHARAR